MNFPLFIAKRYLFAKKSTNVINVISIISMVGVAVATMALVIVLSVFNGFHDLVATFFTQFDAQLKVVPVEGKTAPADDPLLTALKQLPEVDVVTESVEDQALAIYGDHQAMVTVKGVEDNFEQLTHIDEILYGEGEFELHAGDLEYGILGIRLAQELGTGARFHDFLRIYAPQKEGIPDMSLEAQDAFVVDSLLSPGVVFSVRQGKYDKSYILTPIAFARRLFGEQGMVSTLEFRLKPGSNLDKVKKQMRQIAGDRYEVLDRYEQQADTFRLMQIEKFMAYIFLTFILIVACFNIIGSLSMLIIDKQENIRTLHNLGANNRQISQIFLFEGRMISIIGAVTGIALGLLLCWLQQRYGLVSLGESSGSFVVNAYPVSVHYSDVLLVFVTVVVVGWLAVWYPIRNMSRRLLQQTS